MQDKYENMTVLPKANIYFEGRVVSHTAYDPSGNKFTFGVIMPGSYEFDVESKEVIDYTAGSAKLLIPGNCEWIFVKAGDRVTIPENCKFKIISEDITEYVCAYVTE